MYVNGWMHFDDSYHDSEGIECEIKIYLCVSVENEKERKRNEHSKFRASFA